MFDFLIVSFDSVHVPAMVRIIVARYAWWWVIFLATSALGLLHLLLYTIINRKYLLLWFAIILEARLSLYVASWCRPLRLFAKWRDLELIWNLSITKLIFLSKSNLSQVIAIKVELMVDMMFLFKPMNHASEFAPVPRFFVIGFILECWVMLKSDQEC